MNLELFTITILCFCFCSTFALQLQTLLFEHKCHVTKLRSLVLLSLRSGLPLPNSWIVLILVYRWSITSCLVAKQLTTELTLLILKTRLMSQLRAYRGACTLLLCHKFTPISVFVYKRCFKMSTRF